MCFRAQFPSQSCEGNFFSLKFMKKNAGVIYFSCVLCTQIV
jgi:hypothetical protein